MNMKAKIRKTGEIVDVITYSGHTYRSDIDVVSYIDSKGYECVDMKMNRFWDFEDVEECYLSTKENLIDWEERRFQLVKAAMQGNFPQTSFDKESFCRYCISVANSRRSARTALRLPDRYPSFLHGHHRNLPCHPIPSG